MLGRERDGDYRQVIEPKSDGIANAITTVQKDSMVIVPQNTKRGFDIAKDIQGKLHDEDKKNQQRGA